MIYIHIYIVFTILNMRIYKYIDMNDYFIHNNKRRRFMKKYMMCIIIKNIITSTNMMTIAGE
jgi:hypothetical protein